MKKHIFPLFIIAAAFSSSVSAQAAEMTDSAASKPKVYFTSDISPEGLLEVYHALGVKPEGKVAVKISTGESSKSNHLSPELIGPLVKELEGTLVECNTAYGGNRSTTADHRRAIAERGYLTIADVDIMDEEGHIDLAVSDTTYLKFNRVGSHLANYDYLVNLAHFKGHAMGGFGGVIKNQSIGIATPEGKTLIHTAGAYEDTAHLFEQPHGRMPSSNPWPLPPNRFTIISAGK